jgi:hypothetical protein
MDSFITMNEIDQAANFIKAKISKLPKVGSCSWFRLGSLRKKSKTRRNPLWRYSGMAGIYHSRSLLGDW